MYHAGTPETPNIWNPERGSIAPPEEISYIATNPFGFISDFAEGMDFGNWMNLLHLIGRALPDLLAVL